MKREFSSNWKGSSQVRKQRKYRHNAPLHIRQGFLSAHLAKDLRVKHKMRTLPVRKGDEVIVMRGSFAKKKAKVLMVDLGRTRVTLENITRSKKDGSKVPVYFRAHALTIVGLYGDDKMRLKQLPANEPKVQEKKNAPHSS